MPTPYPPYINDDDETTAQQQPDQQQMDQMQLGDVAAQKPQTPPWLAQGPAAIALQQQMQQGPPQMPHPSVWQRLGAAVIGGAAGWTNAQRGHIGGLKDYVDPSGAEAAVLGTAGYQNKLKNWTQQTATMDKAAQLEEQRRKDQLVYEAHEDQMATNLEARKTSIAQRGATADAAKQRNIQAFQQDNPYSREDTDAMQPPVPETAVPPPNQEDPNATQALDLPPLPDAPQEGQMEQGPSLQQPKAAMPWQGPQPTLPPFQPAGFTRGMPAPGYQGPPRYAMNPVKQKQVEARAAADAKNSDLPIMTQELYDMYTKAKVPVSVPVGKPIPVPIQKEMDTAYEKLANPAAPKEDPNDWYAQAINSDPKISGPAQQKIALRRKDIEAGRPINSNAVPGSPDAPNTVAQGQATYHLPPPTPPRSNSGGAYKAYTDQMAQIQAINPNYDPTIYTGTVQEYNNMGRGHIGGNLLSLSTVAAHADDMIRDLAAINSGDTRVLNRIGNMLGVEFGGSAYSNTQLAKEAVVTEIASALKGAGAPSAQEIKAWADSINPNSSPQQQAGYKQTLANLFGRRLDAAQQFFYNQTKRPKENILTDEADQFLSSAGYNTARIKDPRVAATAPQGGGGGYQPGDHRVINGVGYTRNDKGEWHPDAK